MRACGFADPSEFSNPINPFGILNWNLGFRVKPLAFVSKKGGERTGGLNLGRNRGRRRSLCECQLFYG